MFFTDCGVVLDCTEEEQAACEFLGAQIRSWRDCVNEHSGRGCGPEEAEAHARIDAAEAVAAVCVPHGLAPASVPAWATVAAVILLVVFVCLAIYACRATCKCCGSLWRGLRSIYMTRCQYVSSLPWLD